MARPVTVDASVFIRATEESEAGHLECLEFLGELGRTREVVLLPTLVLVEIAAGLARRGQERPAIQAVLASLEAMPLTMFVSLDEALAQEAADVAISCKLRGADSVYATIARHYGSVLVTADFTQLERTRSIVTAMSPAEAIRHLS